MAQYLQIVTENMTVLFKEHMDYLYDHGFHSSRIYDVSEISRNENGCLMRVTIDNPLTLFDRMVISNEYGLLFKDEMIQTGSAERVIYECTLDQRYMETLKERRHIW